ncbi:hypothetical protein IWX90DRAFT_487495 [Phyllosticta citrichinensis]|uniref:Uncharacterized protein n=1 Tax=Phyllosticta citrichinensis TaxID=1130410 RepID=A0ABR1XRD7_9PEZI
MDEDPFPKPEYGPFDPPRPAIQPPPLRPGSPHTIKLKRDPKSNSFSPYTLWEKRRIREGKRPTRDGPKPKCPVRRSTISGDDAIRRPKSSSDNKPSLRRGETEPESISPYRRSTVSLVSRTATTDDSEGQRPLFFDTNKEQTEASRQADRRFSAAVLEQVRKPFSRPRVRPKSTDRDVPFDHISDQGLRSRSQPSKTAAACGRDAKPRSGSSPAADGLPFFFRPFNPFFGLTFSWNTSNEATPPETSTGVSASLPDDSPRTSLCFPEPKPQYFPVGAATKALISNPGSSTWLKDLETNRATTWSLPREAVNGARFEMDQQRPHRDPSCEAYFVERPQSVFDLRTWGQEEEESGAVAEGDGSDEGRGRLRMRMDSARESISKGFQRLVGRKNSSPA